jgi:heme exporter protein C
MHPDMFMPLVVMIVGFYAFYAVTLMLFTRAEILRREYRASWVKQLVSEKLAEK